jgi:hypothetical protein
LAASEATRPATVSVSEPRKIDQLAGQINFEAISNAAKFQATHLVRRFRLAPALATTVAELAFGSAVRQ